MSFFEKILYYQKTYRFVSHVLFWLAVLLISVSSSKYHDGRQFTYGFAFIGDGLYLAPQIVASYFLTYWIVPRFFFRKKYWGMLIAFIAGSYLICVLARFLVVRVAEPIAGIAPEAFETNREILTDIPKLLYVYFFDIFSLAFVFTFVKLLKDQLDIQKRALSLEKQKAEAELKLLKAQLNPHFLFNTLNNIYSLSLVHSTATSPSIARLADILDHILYRCDSLLVPLSGEIKLLNDYIELEKLRYDARLQVNFKSVIDREVSIAPLILLSIIENAFKHGASDDAGTPAINIELEVKEDIFNFKVVNSVISKQHTKNTDEGISLNNLKQQLQLIYGDNYRLDVSQKENWFTVNLRIVLNKQAR